MKNAFLCWEKWQNRNGMHYANFPGIYAIAYSKINLAGQNFSWIEQVIYIGMTNSKGVLKSRLGQFDRTINGGTGHGGARRVRRKYKNYKSLIKNLYVSILPFKCEQTSILPKDLIVMGEVAKHEYVSWAHYVKRFGQLPEFNDKKRSPKD